MSVPWSWRQFSRHQRALETWWLVAHIFISMGFAKPRRCGCRTMYEFSWFEGSSTDYPERITTYTLTVYTQGGGSEG
eukprot:429788-Prymnesium_polylepis.1